MPKSCRSHTQRPSTLERDNHQPRLSDALQNFNCQPHDIRKKLSQYRILLESCIASVQCQDEIGAYLEEVQSSLQPCLWNDMSRTQRSLRRCLVVHVKKDVHNRFQSQCNHLYMYVAHALARPLSRYAVPRSGLTRGSGPLPLCTCTQSPSESRAPVSSKWTYRPVASLVLYPSGISATVWSDSKHSQRWAAVPRRACCVLASDRVDHPFSSTARFATCSASNDSFFVPALVVLLLWRLSRRAFTRGLGHARGREWHGP